MKSAVSPITIRLKTAGHRVTPARVQLMDILFNSKTPLAADEILARLSGRQLAVNKTTVYREIEFLRREGLVHELHFDDRKKRYEISDAPHHHHLICMNCKRVEDVDLLPQIVRAERLQEKRIAERNRFQVSSHCMEFFGLCKKCQ